MGCSTYSSYRCGTCHNLYDAVHILYAFLFCLLKACFSYFIGKGVVLYHYVLCVNVYRSVIHCVLCTFPLTVNLFYTHLTTYNRD